MKKNSGSKRYKYVSPELLDEAIDEVVRVARAEKVRVALLGGCAMQFYGSDRLTGDLDFVAEDLLDALPRGRALSFGGRQTKASNGVEVDLIIREDQWQKLYEGALKTAQRMEGTPALVVRPEYMLAIKIAAGRDKDLFDTDYLLKSGEIDPTAALKVADKFLGDDDAQDVESMLLEYGLLKKPRWQK